MWKVTMPTCKLVPRVLSRPLQRGWPACAIWFTSCYLVTTSSTKPRAFSERWWDFTKLQLEIVPTTGQMSYWLWTYLKPTIGYILHTLHFDSCFTVQTKKGQCVNFLTESSDDQFTRFFSEKGQSWYSKILTWIRGLGEKKTKETIYWPLDLITRLDFRRFHESGLRSSGE